MAKGNIILGYLRGSIGDITFYRAKGQQMSRARNRQPANPRTEPQMATRSRLANAVKFFRQVDTGFFKYAFEDRKNNESDYNAFMRHNLQESGYIGAQASKIFSWPALGIWQMSEGTLPEIGAPFPQPQDAGTSIYFDLGVTLDDSTSTIANLSNLLISGNRNVWRSGDIVTVVIYRATNRATLPTIDVTETHEASSGVIQFRLNSSDQRDLNDLTADVGGVTYALGYDSDGFFIYGLDSAGATAWANDYLGFSVIHTRNTDKGLKVSRSYLASPSWEIAVIAGSQSTQYYQDVLADWGAASTAILQGGLSEATATSSLPFGRVGAFFNTSTQEIMDAPYASVPNVRSIVFVNTPGPCEWIMIVLTDLVDISLIDYTKIRIEGLGGYQYSAGKSEYLPVQALVAFDLTTPLSIKPAEMRVYYDNILIERFAFT